MLTEWEDGWAAATNRPAGLDASSLGPCGGKS